MADVAHDLAGAVACDDAVAAAAITSRLIRLGEDNLFALIEFADQSFV